MLVIHIQYSFRNVWKTRKAFIENGVTSPFPSHSNSIFHPTFLCSQWPLKGSNSIQIHQRWKHLHTYVVFRLLLCLASTKPHLRVSISYHQLLPRDYIFFMFLKFGFRFGIGYVLHCINFKLWICMQAQLVIILTSWKFAILTLTKISRTYLPCIEILYI